VEEECGREGAMEGTDREGKVGVGELNQREVWLIAAAHLKLMKNGSTTKYAERREVPPHWIEDAYSLSVCFCVCLITTPPTTHDTFMLTTHHASHNFPCLSSPCASSSRLIKCL
jgi:hypothetical protein